MKENELFILNCKELKPCPFCGSEPKSSIIDKRYGRIMIWCQQCYDNRSNVSIIGIDAVERWNKRSDILFDFLENKIEKLANMEGEKDLKTLQQQCGSVKLALWEFLDYLKDTKKKSIIYPCRNDMCTSYGKCEDNSNCHTHTWDTINECRMYIK